MKCCVLKVIVTGLPNILGLWIPVTDATSEHGCMFVVPRERDR